MIIRYANLMPHSKKELFVVPEASLLDLHYLEPYLTAALYCV